MLEGERALLYLAAALAAVLLVERAAAPLLVVGTWAAIVAVCSYSLATRLFPTLGRDAAGYVEALRGRGVEVEGLRGRARLLSPLLAGSLERSLNLAESMEARGFGRPGRTRAPRGVVVIPYGPGPPGARKTRGAPVFGSSRP